MTAIEVMHRRAVAGASTWDERSRTLTAVISTGAAVRRVDAAGNPYVEVLDLALINPHALVGLPVLDNHRAARAADQVGVIESAVLDGGKLVAVIRLSSADDVAPIRQRAADGMLSFSIGYSATSQTASVAGGVRTVSIVPKIFEVSIVSLPADGLAKQRSAKTMADENDTIDDTVMPDEQAQCIRSMGELADLPPSWAEGVIGENLSIEDARKRAREDMIKRTAPAAKIRAHVGPSADDPAEIRTRAADALAHRMGAPVKPKAIEKARPYLSMSFLDMARDSLARAGVSTRGMSPDEVFQRAAHGTSDFAIVVSNAANKTLMGAYQAAECPLKQLVRTRDLPNFKEGTALRLGGMGRFEQLTEHGEFKATSRGETGETVRLTTFGRRFDLTRKLLIDDDTGAFGDITAAMGQAAAQTEADLLVGLLITNPKMSDNVVVFHGSRGNLETAGALSEAALSSMRLAMRKRTDLDGKTRISAAPKFLVVGPELETGAEKLLASIYAATTADANVFATRLQLLVEPRIEGKRYYTFADVAQLPSMQLAYLSGNAGPTIQRQEAWDTLGVSFRAFMDVGASWLDWRGAQMNPGA